MTNIPLKKGDNNHRPSLKEFKPFELLTDRVISAIEEAMDFRTYKSGETIASLNQYEGESFFIVAAGSLKITIANPITNEMMISTINAGDAFGLDVVLADCDIEICKNIGINADSDVSVWIVDAHAFRQLIHDRPSLAKTLLFFLAKDTVKARYSHVELKSAPEQRVYSKLLENIQRNDITGFWHIETMPKHRELANLANVEEVDAARAVAYLIQEKIAQRNYPGLIIVDMEALNHLAR